MGGVPQPMQGNPQTEQVRPLAPPPYLASQTAARMDSPVEPWEGTLRLIMLIFGIVLVVAFVAPWSIGDKTIFAWTGLGDAPTKAKIFALLIPGTGVLAILLGLLPLPSAGRGLSATLLGLVPIVYLGFILVPKIEPTSALKVVGGMTLVAGLVIRSQYKASMASRIMVTVGALCVIAFFLIPQAAYDDKPMLVAAFKSLGDAPGKAKVGIILQLLPFVLAALSLLAWLPAPSGGASIIFAWLWIFLPLIASITTLLIAGDIGAHLKGGLSGVLWLPGAAMAWLSMLGYGVATLVGKQLEHA